MVVVRAIISLVLAALFLASLLTGIVLFVEKIALDPGRGRGFGVGYLGTVHAYIALAMGALGLVHMALNWRCLANYVRYLARSSR